jgi:uncharacterized membrane protein YraQ (UPF0718 family)
MVLNGYIGPIIFNLVLILLMGVSYRFSKEKTRLAVKESLRSAKNLLPIFMIVLVIIAFLRSFFTGDMIESYITQISSSWGYIGAALFGSIVHLPAFIAFPIGGQILNSGVNAGVIAVLINTLIMVHTFTIPIEVKEMGWKFAVVRNGLSFICAIIIGIIIGVIY